ncbi:aromatic acid/H+ symport family MFS transporter [Pseudonocardia eucalypti]|uniref:Aromatic acid/H+ symport family MFS transporter n=1 Tax=Pseudonocardia eucalypti TaxID=648755 RepID=A0ABP9PSU6_9PSEU|nr:AAHS family 4-hydroxybenzoate transporter-like MFS transporter [Pseudonocardia eucalypti]
MTTPEARRAIHRPVLALAFLAVLLDGFDTATLAFVVPTLAAEWGVSPASFTLPLVLTNLGVVVGYLCCGALGARIGRRAVLVAGVTLFAVTTLLVAAVLPARSILLLGAVRALTGLGLGAVLPVAVSLATEFSPARRREVVSVTVTLGLASGATLGGFFGGRLITLLGPEGVFVFAGVLPLLLAGVMAWRLPAEPPAEATGRHAARVGRLFDPGWRASTGLLWAFSFLVFVAAYTLTSWVPTLLTGYGFSPTQAPLGLAFVSLGGVLGGILLIPVAARIGIAPALILMPLIGMACMVLVARAPLPDSLLLLALGGAGLGVTASQIGQLTLAVALYPTGTRTTGVGWAAALGRAGSIVGPAVAGILIGLALAGRDIILLTALPVVAAAICAGLLWRGGVRTPRAEPPALLDQPRSA